jgi:pSer/pThr/pTyr-binding forkhead associated (FHA) protein
VAGLVLEIVEGEDAGQQLPLSGSVELGRDSSAGLHIDDTQVSRRHARVTSQDGGAAIEDLGSTNGTYVNDQPLVGPRQLSPGDRIRVGLTVVELRAEQEASQATAIAPRPEITQLGREVLGHQPEQAQAPEESPAGEPDRPAATPFATEETEPAFVPREARGDEQAESDYVALASLVDKRVKRQATLAAYALVALAGIALFIFFALIYTS